MPEKATPENYKLTQKLKQTNTRHRPTGERSHQFEESVGVQEKAASTEKQNQIAPLTFLKTA